MLESTTNARKKSKISSTIFLAEKQVVQLLVLKQLLTCQEDVCSPSKKIFIIT